MDANTNKTNDFKQRNTHCVKETEILTCSFVLWGLPLWGFRVCRVPPKTDTHRRFRKRNRILEPVRIFDKKYYTLIFSIRKMVTLLGTVLFFLFGGGGETF